jgi:hypothetical protein
MQRRTPEPPSDRGGPAPREDGAAPDTTKETPARGYPRRTVLKLGAAAAGGLALSAGPQLAPPDASDAASAGERTAARLTRRSIPALARPGEIARALGLSIGPGTAFAAPDATWSINLLRREDMVNLTFTFIGLALSPSGTLLYPYNLILAPRASTGYIVVDFGPQHIAEEVFQEALPPAPPLPAPPPPPVKSWPAGSSRIAFDVTTAVTSPNVLPYTVNALLDWLGWLPSITLGADMPVNYALIDSRPPIVAPQNFQTGLDIPWGLTVSPNGTQGWAHSSSPVIRGTRTELWHTRLGVRKQHGTTYYVDEADASTRTARAIWGFGFDLLNPPTNSDPTTYGPYFDTSLTAKKRYDIIRNTSDFQADTKRRPFDVERLMLSGLGGWLSVAGTWDPAPAVYNPSSGSTVPGSAVDLIEWRHRTMMARDEYVRTVDAGYLFPFGHRAVKITLIERKIQPITDSNDPARNGKPAAYLRRREWIVVKEPTRTYPALTTREGREMPFRSVTIAPLVTPDLAAITEPLVSIPGAGNAFWPRLGSGSTITDFEFKVYATDPDGREIQFTAPLAFIPLSTNTTPLSVEAVIANYRTGPSSRRTRPLGGQTVAFADNTGAETPGRTSLPTNAITFDGAVPSGSPDPNTTPMYRPLVKTANVNVLAIEQISGKAGGTNLHLYDPYLTNGFGTGAVWAEFEASGAVPMGFSGSTDRVGGVSSPDVTIKGISRVMGPVGGVLSELDGGTFNASTFFDSSAKLLGGVGLASIIDALTFTTASTATASPAVAAGELIPKLASWVSTDTSGKPIAVNAGYKWVPQIHGFSFFEPDSPSSLSLEVQTSTSLVAGGTSTHFVDGRLNGFKVTIAIIELHFKVLGFRSEKGQKPKIDVDVDSVGFAAPLTFLNALKPFMLLTNAGILSDGAAGPAMVSAASSGSSIDVTAQGVTAGFTIAIPTIALGAFSLQNISFGASVTVPFTGDSVRARFSFCTRENPFLVTVSLFGGGGFFAVDAGVTGIEKLEASIEFGANVALNLGVASGAVYVMGGVYLMMDLVEDKTELTGYVRMGGELEVLGLVSVSTEFYMGLTYELSSGDIWGQASVTVEVEVLFFSTSVSMSVERRFKGSDPGAASLGLAGPAAALVPAPITFEALIPLQHYWDDYCDAFGNAGTAIFTTYLPFVKKP